MNQPRIYIINSNPDHDLSSLKHFSDQPPIVLTEGFVPFNRSTEASIAKKLVGFNAEIDYLVLTGSAALAALTISVFKETFDIKKINVLLYHRNKDSYTVDLLDGYVEL